MLIIRSSIMTEFERNFYTLPQIGAILMATFTVTNTNDSGAGSLRQAITSADASTGKNIINFCGLFDDGLAHTISLTGSSLSITDDIIILGRNPNLLTISDDSASRVFDVTSGATATINGLTITNTYNGATGGGGISNEGIFTLNNSIITGNTAGYSDITHEGNFGGGIYNTGTLTVKDSIISDNSTNPYSVFYSYHGGAGVYTTDGYGNGIYNSGKLTLNDSNITGNGLLSGLDGVYNIGYLTVNHSTINGNYGGAIGNEGNLTVNYSTISGNTSSISSDGANIYNIGNLTVNYSTISGNTSRGYDAGGIYNLGNLILNYSNITDNHAYLTGGGIYNRGNLILNYSNITGNEADFGGGIYNTYYGTLTVNYSSINGNTAHEVGGGIYNDGLSGEYNVPPVQLGVVTVSDSTITDNQAHFGGGIYNDGTLTVGNSTIKHNKAFGIELSSGSYESGDGGGIYNNSTYGGTTTVYFNAIACNFDISLEGSNNFISLDDIAGNFINNGYNWIGINTTTTPAGDAASYLD